MFLFFTQLEPLQKRRDPKENREKKNFFGEIFACYSEKGSREN